MKVDRIAPRYPSLDMMTVDTMTVDTMPVAVHHLDLDDSINNRINIIRNITNSSCSWMLSVFNVSKKVQKYSRLLS